jgi:translation initiation factor IF-2
MNISELARKLKLSTEELRDKLPELGFDIGKKAIKVDDRLGQQIVRAWHDYDIKKRDEAAYLKGKEQALTQAAQVKGDVKIPPVLTVKDFASLLNLPVTDVMKELMKNGVMASMNQRIDYDTAAIVAAELGYTTIEQAADEKVELEKDAKVKEILGRAVDLTARPPVIVVMGHVDHGKTKLLDAIRKTDVVSGEAGGITQHIGAYQIKKHGRLLTFIDTPGHEAFTAMRSRGAKVADIAILVVAATESVMPQTVEAIKIAQAAGLPIVVAINKIDLPDANIDRTKQDLAKYDLVSDEWGGKTICVPISAKQNLHIDDLLDQVLLVADMEAEKIKANPAGEFVGLVIEAKVDKGLGPVATVLVKNGTLSKGDGLVVAGNFYGRVRSMKDYTGKEIDAAMPSMPARIIGFKVAPKVGDVVQVTLEKMKKMKAYRLEKQEESFVKQTEDSGEEKPGLTKIDLILRCDVLGSQEAIIESLEKMNGEDLKIKIIQRGLGNITESDVLQADATGAMLLGFNSVPSTRASMLAQEKKLEIKTFKIIYELIDAVKAKINELVKPELVREDLGKVEVLKIFKKEKNAMIVGAKVISGKIEKNVMAAVLRKGAFIEKGKITELQVGKEAVTDAVKGQECGLKITCRPLIEEGDVLDVYKEREIRKVI